MLTALKVYNFLLLYSISFKNFYCAYLSCMKGILEDIKCAFVLSGTMVGAGFATGREIAMYFSDQSLYSALFGGLMCGVLCFLFLILGKHKILVMNEKLKKIIVLICVIITYVAMYAAAEEIVYDILKIRGAGLISAVFCVFIANKGINAIKNINTVIMVSLILLLFLIARNYNIINNTNKFYIHTGLLYAAMNILLSAELAMEFGKNKSNFQSFRIAILSSLFLMILIAFVYVSIYDYKNLSMPLLESAKLLNMKTAAFFIIYSAIFTSMLSSIKLYFDNVKLKNKRTEVAILFATGIIAYFFTFKQIVGLYVVISAMGVFYCISGIFKFVVFKLNKAK